MANSEADNESPIAHTRTEQPQVDPKESEEQETGLFSDIGGRDEGTVMPKVTVMPKTSDTGDLSIANGELMECNVKDTPMEQTAGLAPDVAQERVDVNESKTIGTQMSDTSAEEESQPSVLASHEQSTNTNPNESDGGDVVSQDEVGGSSESENGGERPEAESQQATSAATEPDAPGPQAPPFELVLTMDAIGANGTVTRTSVPLVPATDGTLRVQQLSSTILNGALSTGGSIFMGLALSGNVQPRYQRAKLVLDPANEAQRSPDFLEQEPEPTTPDPQKESRFARLPTEILTQIATLVKKTDFLTSLAVTCRKLQAIAEHITFRQLCICIGCSEPTCDKGADVLIQTLERYDRAYHLHILVVSLVIRDDGNSKLQDRAELVKSLCERYSDSCIHLFEKMSKLQEMGARIRRLTVKQSVPYWWTLGLQITPGDALDIGSYSFPEVVELQLSNKVAVVDSGSIMKFVKCFPGLRKLTAHLYGQQEYPYVDAAQRKEMRIDFVSQLPKALPNLRELYMDTLSYSHPPEGSPTNLCPPETPKLDTFSLKLASLTQNLRFVTLLGIPYISPQLFNPRMHWPQLEVFLLSTNLFNALGESMVLSSSFQIEGILLNANEDAVVEDAVVDQEENEPAEEGEDGDGGDVEEDLFMAFKRTLRMDLIEEYNLAIVSVLFSMPRLRRFYLEIGHLEEFSVSFTDAGHHLMDPCGKFVGGKFFMKKASLSFYTSKSCTSAYQPSVAVIEGWRDRFGGDLAVEVERE
ncbi:hypothetical protein BJ508DRAFT_141691 [Ascobolus immersus RN42]|uniref:F-box domain-containing protein n=1 Tax=Ascobolus immersus RN42 TaxID=1160509 RepID=A0A3N4I1J4_ASCIM|nr:hypothetical protein BJ508DRAFT_141691 [Ascobolus immersus RN42]